MIEPVLRSNKEFNTSFSPLGEQTVKAGVLFGYNAGAGCRLRSDYQHKSGTKTTFL